jgi:probable F420-dependent oxidoreductase
MRIMSDVKEHGLDLRSLGNAGAFVANLSRFTLEETRELALTLESLGLRTISFGESLGREPFAQAAVLLASTSRVVVMTGIASIYSRDAWAMMNAARTLLEAYPDRFVLGIGVSHPKLVTRRGHVYEKPATTMRSYIESMWSAPWALPSPPVPRIVVAALRQRMLQVVRDCADGAQPYFSPVTHTKMARELIGPERWLCPILTAVSANDRATARRAHEGYMQRFLAMPNYRDNLVALGFEGADVEGSGSDRLFDAVVACGFDGAGERFRQHLAAGADHVQFEVLGDSLADLLAGYRDLARIVA